MTTVLSGSRQATEAVSRTSCLKYQTIFEAIRQQIESRRLAPGDRLPSEAALGQQFHVSRITVTRAMRDLQLAGYIERRVGAGSFVRKTAPSNALSFGLVIPDAGETVVFDSICEGMMASPLARQHVLVWGRPVREGMLSKSERAWQLCQYLLERRVDGVFFAPREHARDVDLLNSKIADALDAARIPVVLLGRALAPYSARGRHDLVGIDNRRAGYLITEHLLRLGARRLAFVTDEHPAATAGAREAGYREALHDWDVPVRREFVHRIDPGEPRLVRRVLAGRPEGLVCTDDSTAIRLMASLQSLGLSVPDDVRLVGIDALEAAPPLPCSLTTLRQPAHAIGRAAFSTMLERVRDPQAPVRDILLQPTLIVGGSCGASVPLPVAG